MRFGTRRGGSGVTEEPEIVPTRPTTRSTKMRAWRGSVSFLNLTILCIHAPTRRHGQNAARAAGPSREGPRRRRRTLIPLQIHELLDVVAWPSRPAVGLTRRLPAGHRLLLRRRAIQMHKGHAQVLGGVWTGSRNPSPYARVLGSVRGYAEGQPVRPHAPARGVYGPPPPSPPPTGWPFPARPPARWWP